MNARLALQAGRKKRVGQPIDNWATKKNLSIRAARVQFVFSGHGNQQSTKKKKIQSSNQRSCTNYVLPYYRVTPKLFIIIALL